MEKWVIRPENKRLTWTSCRHLLFHKPLHFHCLRPLPFMACAVAAGAWTAVSEQWFVGVVLLGTVIFWLCRVRMLIKPLWLTLTLPLMFVGSALHAVMILQPAQAQAEQLSGKSFRLQGQVVTATSADQVAGRLFIRQDNGIMTTLFYTGPGREAPYGARIALEVRGVKPDGRRNPGGFDERGWLAAQGVFLETQTLGAVAVLSPPPSFGLMAVGTAIRNRLIAVFDSMLDPAQSALLAGLLVGDTARIDDETQSNFRRSGLAHLMSVSGANVSFLLLPASRLLRQSKVGRKSRLWILLFFLLGFGFVTSWSIPVTRAILMAGCILAGRLLRRPVDSVSALSAAALLIMLLDPLSALSLSFWLSLAATASLLLFAEPLAFQIRQRLPFMPDSLAMALAAAVSVQMVLLPLLAQMNQEISLIGLLANLPAGPLVALITLLAGGLFPVAVLLGMIATSQTWVLVAIGKPLAIGVDMLSWIAKSASQIQFGRLAANYLNAAFWLAWLLFMTVWIWKTFFTRTAGTLPFRFVRHLRWPMMAAWIALTAIIWLGQPLVQVWFLDVGQGDAILILSKNGESVLIDGGSPGKGHQVLMPALDALGVNQLDLVIATHGHADHAGGLLELIKAGRVSAMTVSKVEARDASSGLSAAGSDLTSDLLAAARQAGIRVSEVSGNDTIVLGSLIDLELLNPSASQTEITEINDYSLIMQADLAGCMLLLTADCSKKTEEMLVTTQGWPQADLLKVAHHGSRFSTSASFLASVQPTAAIISVGPNQYGHPAPATLTRLSAIDCTVYWTQQRGALNLSIWPAGWEISYGY